MQRSKQLKALRPSIPTILEEQAISSQEQFQNKVLRPILKLQNDLLVAIFKKYAHKRKGVFFDLSNLKKQAYLQQAIQRDQQFRNLLVGSIIGQFTVEEYTQFAEDEQRLVKRMMDMCVKRLQDHFCPSIQLGS